MHNQDLIFLNSITSENLDKLLSPETLLRLINIIESQLSENAILKIQVQELRDENNRLKGGARVQVRKRDVSLHTITAEGTKAQDTFMTIVQTAKKLGANPIAYFYDRFTNRNAIERFAVLIHKMAGVPPPPVPIS